MDDVWVIGMIGANGNVSFSLVHSYTGSACTCTHADGVRLQTQ